MHSSWLTFGMVGLFYLFFFVVGVVSSRRCGSPDLDDFLLAGRNLPLWLGVLTMTATWVGGGYLNGTAEAVYDSERGLVWAQAPWGYALSLIFGGIFFAGKMRRYGFRTMLDLFESRYGNTVAAVLFVPALLGEVFWCSAILVALGTTFGTILGLDVPVSIFISAVVAIGYTVLGGLRSVAYTDAFQLLLIVFGLGIALPVALRQVGGLELAFENYRAAFGESASFLPSLRAWGANQLWGWQWTDYALLLTFGGIPWQVYFQRVLATRDESAARNLSLLAGVGCFLVAVPAGLLGLVGAAADWSVAGISAPENPALILPYVLKYLTNPWVASFGLAAIAAAVMSSIDSSILSASSMFAWNVYRPLFSNNPAGAKVRKVVRLAVIVVGFASALLALSVQSVYALWFLCTDLVYVILFPQLLAALYLKRSNRKGAMFGIAVGVVLRFCGGEPGFGIPPLVTLLVPGAEIAGYAPFRTIAMLGSLLTIILVSFVTGRERPGRIGLPASE